MKRTVLGAALALALLSPVPVQAAPATAARAPSAVERWDAVGQAAFTATGLSPAEGHPILGFASLAVYDTVVALRGRYEPFAVRASAARGASLTAAVAAAAHRVLVHHMPSQAVALDAAYVAELARTDGTAERDGVALGRRIAAAHLALRADDGFGAPPPADPPPPAGPGVWVPTAPTPPIGAALAHVRPLVLDATDQLRPPPPPALTSRAWARDFDEVKVLGSSARRTSTDPEVLAQDLAARFWAEAPVQQARTTFRRFAQDKRLDVLQTARFMAMVSVAYTDALIACMDAKYAYRFWLPVTAVPAGDTDGNPATVGDPAWAPLLPATPNHPEYPSAHSCLTPGSGLIAEHVLGTRRIDMTFVSLTGLGDRRFRTTRELRTEVANARIWGGIHFRSALDAGTAVSLRTARIVLREHFQPTHR